MLAHLKITNFDVWTKWVHRTECWFEDKPESTNGDSFTPCCQQNGSAVQNVVSMIDPNQQIVTLKTRETTNCTVGFIHTHQQVCWSTLWVNHSDCSFWAHFNKWGHPESTKGVAPTVSPKTCNLLPIHKCHTKACKLLQFTSVRKTCKMLTTHNLPVPRLCKLLQFFAFHSQVPNNGLQTALIHKCQEPCTVPVNLQYALPCYAAPCYAAPCYASPCYAAPCYPAPCYAAPCYDASCYTAPCHATPCHLKRYFSHVLHRNSLMPCCVTLTNAARNLHSLLPKPYNGSI